MKVTVSKSQNMPNYSHAYLDGHHLSPDHAQILQTHALHYATSVFEGIRVYNGKAFALPEHIGRLLRSASILGLEHDLTETSCLDIVQETLSQSGLSHAYIRPIIFQGGPDLGVYAPENKTRFGVLIWDWPSVFGEGTANSGIRLTTNVPYRKPPENCFPAQAKSSAGYLTGAINRRHAAATGYEDALMMTHDGLIAEASGANIFAVLDGTLVTPPPRGILDGITRQTVINKICNPAEVEELSFTVDTLLSATEIFLTGTAYEIMPVKEIDGVSFQPGPVTKRISGSYRDLTLDTFPAA